MLPQRPGWPLLIGPYRTLERPPEADLEAAGHMLAWMLFGWNGADWRRCILGGLAAFALYNLLRGALPFRARKRRGRLGPDRRVRARYFLSTGDRRTALKSLAQIQNLFITGLA